MQTFFWNQNWITWSGNAAEKATFGWFVQISYVVYKHSNMYAFMLKEDTSLKTWFTPLILLV